MYTENVPSSASRSRSWINAAVNSFTNTVVAAAQGISQFISSSSKAALPSNSESSPHSKNEESQRKQNKRNPHSQFREMFSFESCVQNNISVIHHFLDTKYPLSKLDSSIAFEEAQACAINITAEFEKVLKYAAVKSGMSVTNLNFNPVTVQSTIVRQIRNDQCSEISKTLYLFAKEACLKSKQIDKQTDKFLTCLANHLEKILAEEAELLIRKQKNYGLSKVISDNRLVERSVPKEDSKSITFLNNTSTVKDKGNRLLA